MSIFDRLLGKKPFLESPSVRSGIVRIPGGFELCELNDTRRAVKIVEVPGSLWAEYWEITERYETLQSNLARLPKSLKEKKLGVPKGVGAEIGDMK